MKARVLLPGLLAIFLASLDAAPLPRTWTSKDGTATMTATFSRIVGNQVTLIPTNGRAQVIDKSYFSDADVAWIEENSGAQAVSLDGAAAPGNVPATAKIPSALDGKLIDDHGKPTTLGKDGVLPKYYLFYYSASWCGPCHAFTPDLVKFYRKMKGRKASLEVILWPSDESQEDEVAYMKEMRMPWPGLAFDARKAKGVPGSQWGYIPCMVLVDADGKRLLQVNDKFSKEEFLDQTEKLLQGDRADTAQN